MVKGLGEGWVLKLPMAVHTENFPNGEAGEGAPTQTKEKTCNMKPDATLPFFNC